MQLNSEVLVLRINVTGRLVINGAKYTVQISIFEEGKI
jgi:hypothetical protein